MDQVKAALDGFIEQEGVGAVVQFSGGEPTMHPQIVEAVKEAVTRPTEVVMINTNGIKFAQDEDLVKRLVDVSENKLEIYLQFDGFTDEVHQAIRGAKLADIKMKAIEHMLKHGLPINLAAVIQHLLDRFHFNVRQLRPADGLVHLICETVKLEVDF
jgi:hypothetical protein